MSNWNGIILSPGQKVLPITITRPSKESPDSHEWEWVTSLAKRLPPQRVAEMMVAYRSWRKSLT